jgi:hypothetical protein
MSVVRFKTEVRRLSEADGSESPHIELKRRVTRADCDLKPHRHAYYNDAPPQSEGIEAREKTTD